jgi:hypothetical protein
LLDYSISPYTRRRAYNLKRQGFTRKQIADRLEITPDQAAKILGPAGDPIRTPGGRPVSAQAWFVEDLVSLETEAKRRWFFYRQPTNEDIAEILRLKADKYTRRHRHEAQSGSVHRPQSVQLDKRA